MSQHPTTNYFAAFVMTFERSHLINDTIDKLLIQSLPPEKVLIIDNSISSKTQDLFSEYKIKSIDPKFDQAIVVYKTGSEHTLRLTNTPISKANNKLSKKLIAADQLNWPWIKSEANPMKRTAEVLPDWVLKNWDSLSDDVKTDFRNKYRQHGWDFTVNVVTPDRVRVSNTRLIDPNIPPLTDEQLRQKVESSVPTSGLNRTKK